MDNELTAAVVQGLRKCLPVHACYDRGQASGRQEVDNAQGRMALVDKKTLCGVVGDI